MKKINTALLNNAADLLDEKHGKEGTTTREAFNKEAIAFYYGEILKEKRKELHLTQDYIAGKTGLKRSYIAKIEKGETDMQMSSFVRIAEALGLKFSLS